MSSFGKSLKVRCFNKSNDIWNSHRTIWNDMIKNHRLIFGGYLCPDLEYWIFHEETSTILWIHVYLADFSPFHLFGEINPRYNIAENGMIYENIRIKVECVYLMVVVSILPLRNSEKGPSVRRTPLYYPYQCEFKLFINNWPVTILQNW